MMTLETTLETTSDACRLALYRKVLECYGFSGAPSRPRHGVIWCCDPAAADMATDYAVRTGRDVIQTAGLANVPDLSTAQSITLVGRNHMFRTSSLLDLVEVLSVPWGVLTGDDLASLAFVCLKSLGQWNPTFEQPSQIVLDRINGYAVRYSKFDQPAETLKFEMKVLRNLFKTGAYQAVFHAHGEGAHCNFDPLVVCGRTKAQEIGLDGVALSGCADDTVRIRCKRAEPGTVLLLRDVPATFLWLFTCNGISLMSEHYPSDVSLARAAIEGYVSSMVSTLFPVHNSQAEIARIAGKLRGGMPLAYLAQEENNKRRSGGLPAPWVLLGDADNCGQDAVQWHERYKSHQEVAYSNERTNALTASEIENNNQAALLAITLAEDLLLNIKLMNLDVAGRTLLAKLECLRQELSVTLRLLKRAYGVSIQSGGVENEQALLKELRNQLITEWEDVLATLLHKHLAFADHDRLWSDGLEAMQTRTSDLCPRCLSRLFNKRHYLPFARNGAAFTGESFSCPVCGPYSYRTAGFIKPLSVEMPTVICRGTQLALKITLAKSGPQTGQLILGLLDKSRGKQVLRDCHIVTRSVLNIKIPLPLDMGLDLHTLRIVFLSGLEMTALRLRISVMPEGSNLL